MKKKMSLTVSRFWRTLSYLIWFLFIFLEKPTWATMCEFMCRDHSAFLQYIHFQDHYAGFEGWRYPDRGRSSLPRQWTNFGAVNITGIAFCCEAINHIMSLDKHAFMFFSYFLQRNGILNILDIECAQPRSSIEVYTSKVKAHHRVNN